MKRKILLSYVIVSLGLFFGINQLQKVAAAEEVPYECSYCSVPVREYGKYPKWDSLGCPDGLHYHWVCWLIQDQSRCCCNIPDDCVIAG